jgi:hypothetical protein
MNVGRIVVATPVAEKIAALTALATPGVIRLEPSISALAAATARCLRPLVSASRSPGTR